MMHDGVRHTRHWEIPCAPAVAELLVLGSMAWNRGVESAQRAKLLNREREVVGRKEPLIRMPVFIVSLDVGTDLLTRGGVRIVREAVFDIATQQAARPPA